MSGSGHWDERYSAEEYVWKTDPHQFLASEVEGLAIGRSLDLATGEGRNAVWLATQGWQSTGLDFSAVGLAKGAKLAESVGVTVEWIHADATVWTTADMFDLCVVFYLQVPQAQRTAAFAAAAQCLAPGGTVLVVGHDRANLRDGYGGPQDTNVLYSADEVQQDLLASELPDLVIDHAGQKLRSVETADGGAVAIDCLVRAHRAA